MAQKLEVIITGDTRQLDQALSRGVKSTSGFAKGLNVASVAAGGALLALGAAAKVGFDEFNQGEKVAAQTAAVIKSTGGAANVTAKQVDTLASSLMKKSGVDDEAIKSGSNLLLTFTKVRNEAGKGNDIFTQGTAAALDLSVAMGKDLNSSAILVGKALNDPLKGMTALTRAGVQFTDAQKDTIKSLVESGDVMGAQKIILAELTTQFGGSAAAAGGTFAGKMNIAKESAANFAGSLVASAVPALSGLAGGLQGATDWMTRHETATKIAIAATAGLATAVLALKVAFSAGATIKAFWAVLAAHPLVAVAAGIAALGVAIFALRDKESQGATITRRLADANRDLAASATRAAEASRAQTSALLAMQSANLGVKDATLGLKDATVRVTETNNAAGKASGEHTRALLAQERAQISVKQALVAQSASYATATQAAKDNAAATQSDTDKIRGNIDQLRALQLPIAQVAVGKQQATANSLALATAEGQLSTRLSEASAQHQRNAREATAMAAAVRGSTSEANRLRDGFQALAAQELNAAAKVGEAARIGNAAQNAAGKVMGLVAWLNEAARNRTSTINVRINRLPADRMPAGAHGAIVTRPTVALIGEAGPEAVVPLSGTPGSSALPTGRGGVTQIFNFPNYIGDRRELTEMVRSELIRAGRRMPGALGGLA